MFLRSNKTATTRIRLIFALWSTSECLASLPPPRRGRTNLCRSLCSTGRRYCWAQRAPSPEGRCRAGTQILTSLRSTWRDKCQVPLTHRTPEELIIKYHHAVFKISRLQELTYYTDIPDHTPSHAQWSDIRSRSRTFTFFLKMDRLGDFEYFHCLICHQTAFSKRKEMYLRFNSLSLHFHSRKTFKI